MGKIHWRCRILERRMRRTFYYSHGRPMDRLSLPMTQAVVEYFTKNAPFDDLDLEYASDVSYAGAVSPSSLIVAMIYLERMRMMNKDYFESSDPADLFTSALLCACKFLYDEAEAEFVYNDEWARSCSRKLAQVNENELEFLNALGWDVMAHEKDFYRMLNNLETMIARRECQWRGSASYSDMMVLLDAVLNVWEDVVLPGLTIIGAAVMAYTATLMGLYSCSLYASTLNTLPTAVPSPPLVTVLTRSPPVLPAFPTSSGSPEVENVIFVQPALKTNHVRSMTTETSENASPSITATIGEIRLKPKWNPQNVSLCGKEMEKEWDSGTLSPWTKWLYHAVWSY